MVFEAGLREMERGWQTETNWGAHFKVPVASSDADGTRAHGFAFQSFDDPQRTTASQSFGKQLRKDFRHMLNDENGEGKDAGRAGSRISRAAGPPVETPMTKTDGVAETGGFVWLPQDSGSQRRPGRARRKGQGCSDSCEGVNLWESGQERATAWQQRDWLVRQAWLHSRRRRWRGPRW